MPFGAFRIFTADAFPQPPPWLPVSHTLCPLITPSCHLDCAAVLLKSSFHSLSGEKVRL